MSKRPSKPAVKKRNPQDATLRNVRALKRKWAELEKRVQALEDKNDVHAPDMPYVDPSQG